MCDFRRYVLEPRQFNPTFPKQQLIELIEEVNADKFLVDVDLARMVMVIAIPVAESATT